MHASQDNQDLGIGYFHSFQAAGTSTVVKPSLAASAKRRSACATGRSSPPSLRTSRHTCLVQEGWVRCSGHAGDQAWWLAAESILVSAGAVQYYVILACHMPAHLFHKAGEVVRACTKTFQSQGACVSG